MIRRWFKEVICPALKNSWRRSHEKSGKQTASHFSWHNDLTNPMHPLNVGQREMSDYNDRRQREALYDYLQTAQRLQEHQRRHEH